jgi:hypothetical protein
MNEWHQLLKELDEPHGVWFDPTELCISTDGTTAMIICETEQSRGFIDQFYFLTKVFPIIKKQYPTIQHLRVVHGSIYDLVKTQDAVVISFQ